MPGFSLILKAGERPPLADHLIDPALEGMHHDTRYRTETVERSPTCLLTYTGYPGYPVTVNRTDAAILLIEGFVYRTPGQSLNDLTDEIISGDLPRDAIAQLLRDFIGDADGEFAIVYVRTNPDPFAVIALDALGRLPVYWRQDGDNLLVSREMKFIAATASKVQPDLTAIAQTLLLRCPWDDRTLLEDVQRLPAGGVLTWQPSIDSRVHLTQHPWCFNEDPNAGSPEALTDRLVQEFRSACHSRAEAFRGRRLILTLSGGLDSRAVAAGLADTDIPVTAHTFVMGNQHTQAAALIAEQIARTCGLGWNQSDLSMPSPEAVDRLIAMKDGQNSGEMAYAEQFFRSLPGDPDQESALFTGEGGDLALTGRHPERSITTTHELAPLLIERRSVFPIACVSSLLRIPVAELIDELEAILDRYPETTLEGKQLHFSTMAYYHREFFEGEDRNRCYMWTTTPFYSRPFFDLAMTAPTKWKRRRRLQSNFLQRLSPQVAAIPNANNGLVAGSWRDRVRQWARELILSRPGWERGWRATRSGVSALDSLPNELTGRLGALAMESPAIADLFDREQLTALLPNRLSPAEGWLLYTLTQYIDSLDRR